MERHNSYSHPVKITTTLKKSSIHSTRKPFKNFIFNQCMFPIVTSLLRREDLHVARKRRSTRPAILICFSVSISWSNLVYFIHSVLVLGPDNKNIFVWATLNIGDPDDQGYGHGTLWQRSTPGLPLLVPQRSWFDRFWLFSPKKTLCFGSRPGGRQPRRRHYNHLPQFRLRFRRFGSSIAQLTCGSCINRPIRIVETNGRTRKPVDDERTDMEPRRRKDGHGTPMKDLARQYTVDGARLPYHASNLHVSDQISYFRLQDARGRQRRSTAHRSRAAPPTVSEGLFHLSIRGGAIPHLTSSYDISFGSGSNTTPHPLFGTASLTWRREAPRQLASRPNLRLPLHTMRQRFSGLQCSSRILTSNLTRLLGGGMFCREDLHVARKRRSTRPAILICFSVSISWSNLVYFIHSVLFLGPDNKNIFVWATRSTPLFLPCLPLETQHLFRCSAVLFLRSPPFVPFSKVYRASGLASSIHCFLL